MRVWISGELRHDVSKAFMDTVRWLEPKLNNAIGGADYGGGVRKWAFIGIVGAPEDFAEVAAFHQKDGVAEFRLKIDREAFRRADDTERRRLLLTSIIRSIDVSKVVIPAPFDDVRFAADLDRFRQEVLGS